MRKIYFLIASVIVLFYSCSEEKEDSRTWMNASVGLETIKFYGLPPKTETSYEWVGETICGCAHGDGVLIAKTGDHVDKATLTFDWGSMRNADWKEVEHGKFLGHTVKEKPSEFGVLRIDDTTHIVGYFKDKTINGALYFSQNKVYEGEFKKLAPIAGELSFDNGTRKIVNNVFSKKGNLESGDLILNGQIVYTGKWEDNAGEGTGVLYLSTPQGNKIQYNGSFKNGLPIDDGILLNQNGEIYNGEWKNGKFDGEGTLNRGNEKNMYYTGDFSQGKIAGKGTLYVNGFIKYKGEWKDNKFDGKGVLFVDSSKSIQYEGYFKNGKKDGKGVLYQNNFKRYKGAWKQGLFHGQGTFYGDTVVIEGEWDKGVLIKTIDTSKPILMNFWKWTKNTFIGRYLFHEETFYRILVRAIIVIVFVICMIWILLNDSGDKIIHLIVIVGAYFIVAIGYMIYLMTQYSFLDKTWELWTVDLVLSIIKGFFWIFTLN